MLSKWSLLTSRFNRACQRTVVAVTTTAMLAGQFGLEQAFAQSGFSPAYQGIVQAQNAEEREVPLDSRISSMPDVEDQFDVIHHRSQLMLTNRRIKRMAIADPSVIEVAPYSDTEISVIGLSLGTTTLTLWFEDDDDPLIYLVNTIRDPALEDRRRVDYGKLERKLALLFPNSKVYIIPISGKIIVKGQAHDSQEATRIMQVVQGEVINREGGMAGAPMTDGGGGGGGTDGIAVESGGGGRLFGFGNGSGYVVDMLQVPGEFQVMIRARIAELNRSQLRRYGVDLNIIFANGQSIGTNMSGGAPTLSGIFEEGDIITLIDALAGNGTATILSEPALTVLSGRTASFLAGGEFAVPTVVGIGGAQGQTTTFRGFGTSLLVTPTVVDGDNIRLQIVPEFSQTTSGNSVGGIPGLNSRRLSTVVELREGQTIVLGGLLSRQRNTENNRIPWLGSLPVVGPALFNAKRSTEDESELLIIVTPEIVRPMDPDEVPPMPGFYAPHPNDCEFYHYNMVDGAPDQNVYQLAPWGNKSGYGYQVGYNHFNPGAAQPMYSPVPSAGQGPQGQQQQQQPYSMPGQGQPMLSLPQGQPMQPGYSMPPAPMTPEGYQQPMSNYAPPMGGRNGMRPSQTGQPPVRQPSSAIQPVSGESHGRSALPSRLYQPRQGR
ncbi:type II and III secretion system protein family protein [Lacunimicrobium album]